MQQPAVALDDWTLLQARLQRFMTWLLAAFATLAVLTTIALLRTLRLNGLPGTTFVYGVLVVLLLARFALAHRPGATVGLISGGFFCLAMTDIDPLQRYHDWRFPCLINCARRPWR